MICFDEFGPIEVRPYHGRAWRRVRHPARVRATYRRRHGTRQYLAAYDVADNRLMMRCYRRKRCREVLLFLKHWACPGSVDGYGLGFQALCCNCLLS